ncbi:MAG: enoyl-CoA hydratase/isomerase family protein [Sciscionella sp.]|nr:enoyl-CoA hydratase/isomerase family protein [Sciscionella sp.]
MVVCADDSVDVTAEVFAGTVFEHVRVEAEGDLLWVVLNRPGRLNAMTDLMKREFLAIYENVDRGPWRCVIIAGEGRAFCSGADLGQIGGVIDFADAERVRGYLDAGWQRVIELLRTVPVPTVAAVHGAAYGGGANLALAADLIVAADTATFCQSYIDRGISPDLGGTVLLPRLVGVQHARKQLLLGTPVPADEALRIGMVCEVVPEATLRDRARALATALAGKDPTALRVTRALIDGNVTRDLHTGLAHESRGVGETLSSPIFKASTDRYTGPAGHVPRS